MLAAFRFAPPTAPCCTSLRQQLRQRLRQQLRPAAPPAVPARRSLRLLRPSPISQHLARPTQDLKYSADIGRSPQVTVPFASDSNCIKHECAWVDGKCHHARIPASSGFELMCMSFPTVRTSARSSGLPTRRRRRCSFLLPGLR